MQIKPARGFTLLEILLVVAAIAILAGIVIVAINPARQLGETRDAQRRSDTDAIANALVQYYIKNGRYPSEFPSDGGTCEGKWTNTSFSICTPGYACTGYSLQESLVEGDYLAAIPQDPIDPSQTNPEYSGYLAFQRNSRVVVCAPYAETDSISVTR